MCILECKKHNSIPIFYSENEYNMHSLPHYQGTSLVTKVNDEKLVPYVTCYQILSS
jgi:hypothetical protein